MTLRTDTVGSSFSSVTTRPNRESTLSVIATTGPRTAVASHTDTTESRTSRQHVRSTTSRLSPQPPRTETAEDGDFNVLPLKDDDHALAAVPSPEPQEDLALKALNGNETTGPNKIHPDNSLMPTPARSFSSAVTTAGSRR
ncbi:hypothetical protein NP233_g12271 [Leucocoprinus birnbaumii]|uniref:Uncharacterized protein n=1 Tax=Leucocoprinus birnbaumii TaxID=56174 RepID=A0AAD5VFE5_9AGAR|nr:hypothetical protein NP233_g12271 [Leucocoprinus birnbaumii]